MRIKLVRPQGRVVSDRFAYSCDLKSMNAAVSRASWWLLQPVYMAQRRFHGSEAYLDASPVRFHPDVA